MSEIDDRKSHEEEHEEHIDERWLVSYADMMTLLFGLFVILFSMASEKEGDYKQNLKSISESATNISQEIVETPDKTIEELASEVERYKQLIDESKINEQKLIDQVQQNLNEITSLKNIISELEQKETLMNQKNETFKKNELDIENAMLENKKLKEELEKKLDLLKQIEADLDDKNKKLAQIEKKPIERKISSNQEMIQITKKELEEKNLQIKDLSKKIIVAEEEIQKLKELLKETDKKNNDNRSYLFVLFKWTTEKHDLDLTVEDPKGNIFSFKKKSHPGISGLFALDSRTGPGAEIWQSNEPIPGRYVVILKLYNNYGNLDPASVSGSILSNKSSIPIQEQKIDSKSGTQLKLIFDLNEKGVIKLL